MTESELLEKLRINGRIAEADLSNDELRLAMELVFDEKIEYDLFNERKDGTLISLHNYYFISGDQRYMNGRLTL